MSDKTVSKEHVFDGVVYEGGVTPENLTFIRDTIEYKKDDIMVATYPKAGTTWMQEIIWLIQHGPGSADAREKSFDEVFPYMELDIDNTSGLAMMKELPEPRLFKTHLSGKFFQRQLDNESAVSPRIVLVIRNPKDSFVSYYNFLKMWTGEFFFPGDWMDFFELIKVDRVPNGNYIDHALSWWKYRDHPRVHIVRYEELKKNARPIIRGIAEFLGKQLSEEYLDAVVDESSFEAMKARPMEKVSLAMVNNMTKASNFYNKGKVGNWKTCFTEEQLKFVDDMVATRCTPAGLYFEY